MSQGVKRAAGSLDRGLDVLELLAEHGERKLAELPAELGCSRATAFRVLAALQRRGYVVHNKEEHSYGLGSAAVALGQRSRAAALLRAAEPTLNRLRDDTGETVNLAVFEGGRLIYLRILDGSFSLRMSGVVGDEAPIHATALGRALLANLPETQHRALAGPEPYAAFTAATPTTLGDLEQEVAQARQEGYAIDDQGVDVGAVCVGAAILGIDGAPVGGVSLSGPEARLSDTRRYGRAVAEAAAEISRDLAGLTP